MDDKNELTIRRGGEPDRFRWRSGGGGEENQRVVFGVAAASWEVMLWTLVLQLRFLVVLESN